MERPTDDPKWGASVDFLSLPIGDSRRSPRASMDPEGRAFAVRCCHSGPRPSLFWCNLLTHSCQFQPLYQIDPDLSIMKMILSLFCGTKMGLECAQGGNKDTRRRLLANPSPIPTLLERPLLQRPFPP